MSESIGAVLDAVDDASRRLGQLARRRGDAESACAIGAVVSHEVSYLLDELGNESPAAHAAARAAAERFDSHVLAASMLEASDASTASVFELVTRGLDRLRGDLVRLGRSSRQPV